MNIKQNVIITGTSGFIGSNLVEYLNKNYNVIGIDKDNSRATDNFYHQDINDTLPDISNVYAVIHLAAKAGIRQSQDNFGQYVKDNILGTKNILDKCCYSWKPVKILMASSSSIYGDEMTEYHPKSLYAMSKIGMEYMVQSYKNSHLLDGIQDIILRIYTVYGPKQRKDLAINKFITNILQDKPITVYGDGNQRRDYTYVDDLCYKIEHLLKVPSDMPLPIVPMGNNKNYSVNDIIHMLSVLLNKDVTIHHEPMSPFDVIDTLSIAYYREITPILEGLRKQIEWHRSEL